MKQYVIIPYQSANLRTIHINMFLACRTRRQYPNEDNRFFIDRDIYVPQMALERPR